MKTKANASRLNRRDFLRLTCTGAAAMSLAPQALGRAAAPQKAPKPNIIFILGDDLGIGDVGCYGQKLIQTPNIDKLAVEGMKYNTAYCGSAVCAPCRSALMTGQHTGHTRIRWNADGYQEGRILLPEDVTVAEVLKKAGYATGAVGKWGLGEPNTTGEPNKKGFDFWYGYLDQVHAHEYYTDYLFRNEEKVVLKGNLDGKQTEYSADLTQAEALKFIRAHKDEPFFLYHAGTLPHGKYQVLSLEPYADKPWPETQKAYAAMVARLDRYVAEIMALLKELGLDDNTIVFFTSDNGPSARGGDWDLFRGGSPFRALKGSPYEGGIRAPMIVRWPGKIQAGAVTENVCAFWDFLPTAAELAGVAPPANTDGISMLPGLLGKPQPRHDFLYWETYQGGWAQAARMGDWKGVRWGTKEPLELYNLKDDVGETKNVAAEHPDVVKKLEAYLATARTESKRWQPREYRQPAKAGAKKTGAGKGAAKKAGKKKAAALGPAE